MEWKLQWKAHWFPMWDACPYTPNSYTTAQKVSFSEVYWLRDKNYILCYIIIDFSDFSLKDFCMNTR